MIYILKIVITVVTFLASSSSVAPLNHKMVWEMG